MNRPPTAPATRRAFVLIEVMIGVMIFALGVVALGRALNNCLSAESLRHETDAARLALENRMALIEAGQIAIDKPINDKVGDSFPGMTIKQQRHQLSFKNEKDNLIQGLYRVDLEVDWTSGGEPQARSLSFYVLRRT